MKANDDVEVLVAIKVFGMGINLLNLRFIFNVGIAEDQYHCGFNSTVELGEEAHAYLLFNENLDIKILKFWLRETKI